MSRPRKKAKLSHPASVKAFKAWLTAAGAEVLDPTNEYELVRFRTGAGLALIYTNDAGRAERMFGQAEEAWTAFKNDDPIDLAVRYAEDVSRPIASTDAAIIAHAAAGPITIAFLMDLDLITTREASVRLFGLERQGHLVRVCARPAMRWGVPA